MLLLAKLCEYLPLERSVQISRRYFWSLRLDHFIYYLILSHLSVVLVICSVSFPVIIILPFFPVFVEQPPHRDSCPNSGMLCPLLLGEFFGAFSSLHPLL